MYSAIYHIFIYLFVCSEEVHGLLKILVFYFEEDKASKLQTSFRTLLLLVEDNMKEIWINEKESRDTTSMFGPHATVQSILAQRQNVVNSLGTTNGMRFIFMPVVWCVWGRGEGGLEGGRRRILSTKSR